MNTNHTPNTPELQVRLVPIEKLIPYSRNARTHSEEQIAQVAASIREFGFVNPVLIRPSGVLIAGHARLLAARQLGFAEVPTIEIAGLTEAQYRALAIADNRLALNASWDEEMLRAEIAALNEEDFDVTLLGFGDDELAAVLALDAAAGETHEDAVPDKPRLPVTVPGDVWLLGDHRVLCGDARLPEDLAKLMRNELASLVVTDMPYNVDLEGATADHLKIQNDNMSAEDFQQFLQDTFRSYRTAIVPEASLYVFHASRWQREFQNAMEEAGFEIRCQIIWAKNTFAWGFARYKFQHEPIFYAHVAGQRDGWYGNKSQSTVWHADKPSASRTHPSTKPTELIERALINSSRSGDVVLDLFGGSGSTLIACERRRRKARLMEIDPLYCDVILRRWQAYTGKKAVLECDSRTYDDVTRLRQAPMAA